jgi:hypothetical protein
MTLKSIVLACLALVAVTAAGAAAAPPVVRTVRVPNGGVQPQVAVDDSGVVHLIYLKGDPAHADVYYVRSNDNGRTFSTPIRVNSEDGSAIAVGTIRGAHLAIGKGGRVHVAWNGSTSAKIDVNHTPMLYARMNDAGTAFEPQRNLITERYGLDGGGSVAADGEGNVYVAWHAPLKLGTGEASRRVWIAKSADDGRTFRAENQAFGEETGACGCCGMRLFADPRGHGGSVFALYRSAFEQVHRDIYLLRSDDHGTSFAGTDIAPMNIGICVMSSAAMAATPKGEVLAAWETQSQVYWSRIDASGPKIGVPIAAPGEGRGGRKHPALAADSGGNVLLAWAEGTGWNKGGSIAWQVFYGGGKPVPGASGQAPGLAVWSLPAAFAERDGGFVILY